MGQTPSSSSSSGSNAAGAVQKSCYYDLLEIPRSASQDEIKKAYRKKALELHPDRNYNNDVERATRLFAEAQTAYQVLSDPHEREWYDNHREAFIRGGDPGAGAKDPGTSAEEVMSWFAQFSAHMSFDDHDGAGFYAAARGAFAKLAAEEQEAAAQEQEGGDECSYPGFGGANESEEHVRGFYAAWTNFATRKSFAWYDAHKYSEAVDRQQRRAMEKQNAMLRAQARHEFNDTVISLARFVRRRDPRISLNNLTTAQRQAELLKHSRQQAARQRAENARRRGEYRAAAWTRGDADQSSEASDGREASDGGEEGEEEGEQAEKVGGEGEEGAEEEERWECLVCKKAFRSQGQMDAHEKSKKHVKAVQQLKRQMLKENRLFDLDRHVRGRSELAPVDDGDAVNGEAVTDEVDVARKGGEKKEGERGERKEEGEEEEEEGEEEEHPECVVCKKTFGNQGQLDAHERSKKHLKAAQLLKRQMLKENKALGLGRTTPPDVGHRDGDGDGGGGDGDGDGDGDGGGDGDNDSDGDGDSDGDSDEEEEAQLTVAATTGQEDRDSDAKVKMGKAKAKRAKRAQQKAAENVAAEPPTTTDFTCTTCHQGFASKSRLFGHLKENPKHARPVPVGGSGGGGGKKKKGGSKR